MEKIFYIIKVGEPRYRNILNAMRLVANPAARSEAHVTVRGPYEREIDITRLSKLVEGHLVSVIGAGKFFSDAQCTVFLRCGFSRMQDVWHKPDFPGMNGHISIYDGHDQSFAIEIFEILNRTNLFFSFYASKLEVFKSSGGNGKLDLPFAVNFQLLERLAGVNSVEKIQNLRLSERLYVFSKLISELENVKNINHAFKI